MLEGARARLRHAAEKPAGSVRPRRVVVGLLLLAAIALAVVLSPNSSPPPPPPPEASVPAPTVTHPAAATAPAPRQLDEAKRAARRFLRGYLAFTHGQRAPITDATPDFEQRIADSPLPRVPPAQRRDRGRVGRLAVEEDADPDRVTVAALIRDGQLNYSIRVLMRRDHDGWRAADVIH